MKPFISYAFLAAAAASGFALGQPVTAKTTPVGYVTVPILGTDGASPRKLNFAAHGLLPSGAVKANGTVDSYGEDVDGKFIVDADLVLSGPVVGSSGVSHLVEVTSGPLTGSLTWITKVQGNNIYVSDDLSGAGAEAKYRILKAFTLAELFGAVPDSTVLAGGSSLAAADEVQIYDPTTNSYTVFWYKNSGLGGTGWRTTDASVSDPANYAIFPNDGLVVLRKQVNDGALVVTGEVKVGQNNVLVQGEGATTLNILSTLIPVEQLKLVDSGLYTGSSSTGLAGGSSLAAADELLVYNAETGVYTTFWYKNAGLGGTGWRSTDASISNVDEYVIPADSAILIRRKNNGQNFAWTVPGVNVN